jgi:hypothetical protein
MAKAKSKRQAGLFGAVAGGKSTKAKGMSKKQAKDSLRGVRVKSLPRTAKKKGR